MKGYKKPELGLPNWIRFLPQYYMEPYGDELLYASTRLMRWDCRISCRKAVLDIF